MSHDPLVVGERARPLAPHKATKTWRSHNYSPKLRRHWRRLTSGDTPTRPIFAPLEARSLIGRIGEIDRAPIDPSPQGGHVPSRAFHWPRGQNLKRRPMAPAVAGLLAKVLRVANPFHPSRLIARPPRPIYSPQARPLTAFYVKSPPTLGGPCRSSSGASEGSHRGCLSRSGFAGSEPGPCPHSEIKTRRGTNACRGVESPPSDAPLFPGIGKAR